MKQPKPKIKKMMQEKQIKAIHAKMKDKKLGKMK